LTPQQADKDAAMAMIAPVRHWMLTGDEQRDRLANSKFEQLAKTNCVQ